VKVVSLFAGIGGFDLGFQRSGMEIVAHVEIDPQCRELLQSKWPDAACFDDVRTVGKHNLPDADIICGGFPCQDLSVAGKRAGLEGKRSGLFYEMTRITDELRPAFLIWENVPGLISSDGGKDFYRVLTELDRIGYSGAWRTLDAQYLGVAQRRRRVFGCFARADIGAARCAEILSLREGMSGHPPPRREKGERIAGTVKGGTGGMGHPDPSDGNGGGLTVAEVCGTLSAVSASKPDRGASEHNSQLIVTNRMTAFGEYVDDGTASTLKQRDYKDATDLIAYNIATNDGGEHKRKDRPNGGMYVNETDTSLTVGGVNLTAIVEPVAFQPRYFTRDNKTGGAESCGDTSAALSAQAAGGDSAQCVAFSTKESGKDATFDITPPLRAESGDPHMTGRMAVAFRNVDYKNEKFEEAIISGLITRSADRSRAAPLAFCFKPSHFTRGKDGAPSEVVPPLSADADKGDQEAVVAFHRNASCSVTAQDDITAALRSNAEHSNQFLQSGMQVRRLTPTECERLQGFPDGWTKGFSDSARYRMLGNAVCVNVAEWIGRRIMQTQPTLHN